MSPLGAGASPSPSDTVSPDVHPFVAAGRSKPLVATSLNGWIDRFLESLQDFSWLSAIRLLRACWSLLRWVATHVFLAFGLVLHLTVRASAAWWTTYGEAVALVRRNVWLLWFLVVYGCVEWWTNSESSDPHGPDDRTMLASGDPGLSASAGAGATEVLDEANPARSLLVRVVLTLALVAAVQRLFEAEEHSDGRSVLGLLLFTPHTSLPLSAAPTHSAASSLSTPGSVGSGRRHRSVSGGAGVGPNPSLSSSSSASASLPHASYAAMSVSPATGAAGTGSATASHQRGQDSLARTRGLSGTERGGQRAGVVGHASTSLHSSLVGAGPEDDLGLPPLGPPVLSILIDRWLRALPAGFVAALALVRGDVLPFSTVLVVLYVCGAILLGLVSQRRVFAWLLGQLALHFFVLDLIHSMRGGGAETELASGSESSPTTEASVGSEGRGWVECGWIGC